MKQFDHICQKFTRKVMTQQRQSSFPAELSHGNLPPLTHAALSGRVWAFLLSFSSALRVVSSAIWSIASHRKKMLRVWQTWLSWTKSTVRSGTQPGQSDLTFKSALPRLLVLRCSPAFRKKCNLLLRSCMSTFFFLCESSEHPGEIILHIAQDPFGLLPAVL